MNDTFTIGLVQTTGNDAPEINLKRTEDGVREAAAEGAQVICLQELFRTPYPCQSEDTRLFDLAEPIPGPSTERMAALARELEVALIVPLFERRAPGVYHNTAAVIDADGRLLGTYRKMHIPDDPLFYEKFYFTPGDTGVQVFHTRYGAVAPLICWDGWFPEVARLAALAGAEVIFYPTAIGWQGEDKHSAGPQQLDAWKIAQRGHAIANGCYVAVVNRTGTEGGIEFWGRSFICDPFGVVIASAEDGAQVLTAVVDRRHMEETRRSWPFLRDRRIDAYDGLQNRVATP